MKLIFRGSNMFRKISRFSSSTVIEPRTVFCFPGQGSITVGIGKDLVEACSEAKKVYEEAESVIGKGFMKLCFEGPEETLLKTENAQPAQLCHSIAVLRSLQMKQPSFVMGHSLGEFSALVAGGHLRLGDALALVKKRGFLMQKASDETFGPNGGFAMSVLMPISRSDAEKACSLAMEQLLPTLGSIKSLCQVANVNSPSQIVISGASDAIELACKISKDRFGMRRAVPLKVSAPFHSQAMKSAEEPFLKELDVVRLKGAPSSSPVPYVRNSDAKILKSWEGSDDLSSKVLWSESVLELCKTFLPNERIHFLEFGGTVVGPLVKANLPKGVSAQITSISTLEHLNKFKQGLL